MIWFSHQLDIWHYKTLKTVQTHKKERLLEKQKQKSLTNVIQTLWTPDPHLGR